MLRRWMTVALREWGWGCLVFGLGLCATAAAVVYQVHALDAIEHSRLEQATRSAADAINRRVVTYSEIAFGLRSLFVANPAVGRKEFDDAVQQLRVGERYPGVKNIAFTRYVANAQRADFERAVRADKSLEPGGNPGFSIRPPGERPEYFVADYLWPWSSGKSVHGLDISAQPANLASMRYAIETGLPTASGPFDLIQEVTDKTGFVVRVPVFAQEPRRRFLGSVAVTLRTVELFGNLEREGALKDIHISLTDLGSSIPGTPRGAPSALFSQHAAHETDRDSAADLDVYGRKWRLTAHADSSFLSVSEQQTPALLAAGGGAISLLLGFLVGLLARARQRALDDAASTHLVLQKVLESVPIRVFWKDLDGRYLGGNQPFAADAGHAGMQDVVGRKDSDLSWSAQAESYRQDDLAVMGSGEGRLHIIEPQTRSDGRVRWVETSKVPLQDAEGQLVGVLGVYDDITDRYLKDRELELYRTSLEHMVSERTAELEGAYQQLRDTQLAMDTVGIGIHWVRASDATLLDVNDYAARLLGYTVEEMRGMRVEDIAPVAVPSRFAQVVARAREEEFVRLESEQRSRSGQLIPVELIVYFQAAQEDAPDRLITFVTDISARKASERALVRAKAAAEAANTAKSAFLANMSHEIRTPLNAITGMAYLIRRSGLSAEQSERMHKLEVASQHLLHIIGAILELSKIEAGKFTVLQEPVHVQTLLGNVATMLRDRAMAKQLRLTVESDTLPARLLGDQTRLQQCLLNYANNAVKFTDTGAIALRARIADENASSVLIRFEVEDSGIGIAAQTLPRLFNVFEQADNSTTRNYGGTGLGLAITRKLAELMGGEAGAQSEPGRGSLFWFTVRLHKTDELQAQLNAGPRAAADIEIRTRHEGARVLVAEDDPVNQEVAASLLSEAGLHVEIAEDGHQAVERCRVEHFDLVLMDMQMPQVDGLQATVAIRALQGHLHTPVIAMTGNSFAEDRLRCLEAGMNDFISKPADPLDLYAIVLRWLDASSARLDDRPTDDLGHLPNGG